MGSSGAVVTSSSRGSAIIRLGHVHVYRKGKLVVQWDLDNTKPMQGAASKKLLDLIGDLENEGRL